MESFDVDKVIRESPKDLIQLLGDYASSVVERDFLHKRATRRFTLGLPEEEQGDDVKKLERAVDVILDPLLKFFEANKRRNGISGIHGVGYGVAANAAKGYVWRQIEQLIKDEKPLPGIHEVVRMYCERIPEEMGLQDAFINDLLHRHGNSIKKP